jgi:hypothetical protein
LTTEKRGVTTPYGCRADGGAEKLASGKAFAFCCWRIFIRCLTQSSNFFTQLFT